MRENIRIRVYGNTFNLNDNIFLFCNVPYTPIKVWEIQNIWPLGNSPAFQMLILFLVKNKISTDSSQQNFESFFKIAHVFHSFFFFAPKIKQDQN